MRFGRNACQAPTQCECVRGKPQIGLGLAAPSGNPKQIARQTIWSELIPDCRQIHELKRKLEWPPRAHSAAHPPRLERNAFVGETESDPRCFIVTKQGNSFPHAPERILTLTDIHLSRCSQLLWQLSYAPALPFNPGLVRISERQEGNLDIRGGP
jgi:hypothetical protein